MQELLNKPHFDPLCWASQFCGLIFFIDANYTEGAFGGVMVRKLDKETFTTEFESYWVPHSYSLLPHLSKKLRNLLMRRGYNGAVFSFAEHLISKKEGVASGYDIVFNP